MQMSLEDRVNLISRLNGFRLPRVRHSKTMPGAWHGDSVKPEETRQQRRQRDKIRMKREESALATCDHSHRKAIIDQRVKDWQEFNEECGAEEVIAHNTNRNTSGFMRLEKPHETYLSFRRWKEDKYAQV